MIKIFRNIRKNLLTGDLPAVKVGKTIKYFKYAIGEIILVVIGILIAVQVNSWNTDHKDKKLEKRYITDLIQDLQADSVAIAEYRIISDEQVRTKIKLMDYYDEQSYPKDSLVYYFDTQWKAIYNFTPILTTLEEMKSTGNIGVISNIDLRRKILKTYNSYDVHIKNNEDIYKRLQEEFWKLILSEIPNIYPNEVNKILSYELDIETTLKNFEIENRLKINHAMGMNTAIINLQDINNKLITELQRYL